MTRPRPWYAALFSYAFFLIAAPATQAETLATFTTDSLSFISFGDAQVVPIPPGSTITFRFEAPASDGTTAFSIRPGDMSIEVVELPGSQGLLRYSLGSVASGTMTPTPDGRRLEFNATVRAALSGSAGAGSFDYAMPFSTDTVAATSLDGAQTLSTYGMRIIDGVWFAQIVGATTNKQNAFPEPGAAVYTVLSGQFDSIPE